MGGGNSIDKEREASDASGNRWLDFDVDEAQAEDSMGVVEEDL